MTEKTEALRLAEVSPYLEGGERGQWIIAAAAELRRLHAENEALQNTKHHEAPRGFVLNPAYLVPELKAQRDALLEALRTLLSYANVLEMRLADADGEHRAMQKARAAIAKAEGEGA